MSNFNKIDVPLVNDRDTGINVVDSDGNVVLFLLVSKAGYVNVDIHRSDAKARVFELDVDGHVAANGRRSIDLGEFERGFVSIDFTSTDECSHSGASYEGDPGINVGDLPDAEELRERLGAGQ